VSALSQSRLCVFARCAICYLRSFSLGLPEMLPICSSVLTDNVYSRTGPEEGQARRAAAEDEEEKVFTTWVGSACLYTRLAHALFLLCPGAKVETVGRCLFFSRFSTGSNSNPRIKTQSSSDAVLPQKCQVLRQYKLKLSVLRHNCHSKYAYCPLNSFSKLCLVQANTAS